ncbi:MAG: hypothetical protein U5R31_15400 [Acidimicrobiia bacterium]|nr:hypothetical protein [Acidimicrobiia bacterium]
MITDTIGAQRPDPTRLTIHADRGVEQTAKPVAELYADLGITRSHSRPRVSNDNPTAKPASRPSSTGPTSRSGSTASKKPSLDGNRFFDWYNFNHHHWGLALLTPAQVHFGQADTVIDDTARACSTPPTPPTPNDSPNDPPRHGPPAEAWINRPDEEDSTRCAIRNNLSRKG